MNSGMNANPYVEIVDIGNKRKTDTFWLTYAVLYQ